MTHLSDIEIGIGTAAWGKSVTWGFGDGYGEEDLREAFAEVTSRPNILIDTAEIYGRGRSESYIGEFRSTQAHQPLLATKFFPFPWRLSRGTLMDALRNSLGRLDTPQVDLYQIHWPLPPVGIQRWMNALVTAAESGLTRFVGVSNFNTQQTLTAHSALAKRGIALTSNQVRYNLLDRRAEYSGLLNLCEELGVRVIAYSPLAQGLLTGKYTIQKPPTGVRGVRYRHLLQALEPLITNLREIGRAYQVDGIIKTPAQVALNWCICKGTLPIPGVKNLRQAQHNLDAASWRLADEEVQILDRLSDQFHAAINK